MSVDKGYENLNSSMSPCSEVLDITPSDATEFKPHLRGISTAIDGLVAIETLKGDAPATVFLKAGVLYPAFITKVLATGTIATGITGGR